MYGKAIRLLLLVTVLLGVAACGPTPEPQTVVETVIVEKEVKVVETVIVEKEVVVQPTAAPDEETVVTFGSTLAMDTFDPVYQTYAPGYGVTKLVFETLVEHDENMDIAPLLAESWEISEDGRTWTFHLRQGVKFHDGTPFNAEAVKYSWERFLDPDVGAKDTGRLQPFLEKVEAIDEHTLAVTTPNPFPEFLTNLTDRVTAILSPTALEKYEPMDFGHEEPVGTGPFMFDRWVGTDQIELVANPDYWGPNKPLVDRFIHRIIPEAASLVAALEAGEIDIVSPLNPDDAVRLRDNPDIFVGKYDGFLTCMDGMLMTLEPFSDVRVRQAINYAVDKEAITESIFLGFAKPTETVLFPGLAYRVPQPPYEYNPEKARQLLAEAGYPNGFETEFAYSPGYPKGKEAAEATVAYLADVGIQAELNPMESTAYAKYYRETAEIPSRRIFMQIKAGFGVDFNLSRLFSKATWDEDNRSRFYDPEVERLLDEARYSFDEELRTRNYAEVQRIVWEAAPEIFMYTLSSPYATRANVKGVWFKSDDTPMMAGVYVEK